MTNQKISNLQKPKNTSQFDNILFINFWLLTATNKSKSLRPFLLSRAKLTGVIASYSHQFGLQAVMSTNIRIFEYSIKIDLKYYLYSYSCHFSSTNIFGYLFVDFWTTKYIRIFVCEFSKIRLYLNICSEPYFNIQLSIFIEKK